jgi:hypothetical protein
MDYEDERRRIRDAINRLLAGVPIRSTGSWTIVTLATEAGVKRVALTHRHTDLQQEFRDRAKALDNVPPKEAELKLQVQELKESLRAKERELARLLAEEKLWSRLVRALELDNDAMRRECGKPPLRGLPPLSESDET